MHTICGRIRVRATTGARTTWSNSRKTSLSQILWEELQKGVSAVAFGWWHSGQPPWAKRSATSKHFPYRCRYQSRRNATGGSAQPSVFQRTQLLNRGRVTRHHEVSWRFIPATFTSRFVCGQAWCKRKDGKSPSRRTKLIT